MAVKPLDEYDSPILYAYQTMTVNGEAAADGYNLDLTLDGLDLYDALRVNAPLEADVASVQGMLELTWTQDGGTTYASTQNVALVTINNDVIRGNEATPINLPSPESWLNTRAVRYDTPQSLSLSQQQRAQQNIGLPKAKWDGNREPNADDDETLGYSAGSLWIDVIGKEAYRCVDSTEGAAEWIETTVEVTEISGGPNLITDSTQTTLEGFLYGEGGDVKARLGSTGVAANTVAIRSANGSLTASNIEIYAKAATAITKGAVVYISGAAGENKIISPAIASSEATSSKTIGVAIQSLAQNGFGYVLTEGDITGLGIALTSGHGIVEGDPIWLSPTVAGGMVFKVANKPAAPNHMVFIGYVTKVDGNTLNGIYVKVQNGFELEELHNVQISSPSNNQVLSYDSVNGLWKNTTPAVPDTGVVAPTADTVVKRNDVGGVHANHIRLFKDGKYAQITIPAEATLSSDISFGLPTAAGTIATNNTAVMLSGNQTAIGGNKSFSGLIQMSSQNANDPSNALTVGVGDARYPAFYKSVSQNDVTVSSTSLSTVASITLPAGFYTLTAFIAVEVPGSGSAANATVRVASNFPYLDAQVAQFRGTYQVGSYHNVIGSLTTITNYAQYDTSKEAIVAQSTGTNPAVYVKYDLVCLVQATTTDTIRLQFRQTASSATSIVCRKGAFITATKLS